MRQITPDSRGFTLIELSIVLVIIGLIAGGVLVGRTLIKSAEIRSQIKQFQDYQVAFVTFQGKYGCVPGDCTNATTFFGTTFPSGNSVVNGNGNGLVDTFTGTCYDIAGGAWADHIEMWSAYEQLAFTRLIDFSPSNLSLLTFNTSLPLTKMGQSNSGFFIGANYNFTCSIFSRTPDISSYRIGENALWFVACADSLSFIPGMDDLCGIFLPGDLMAIDQKIDDGRPLSGKLLGFGGYNDPDYAPDDHHVSCVYGLYSDNRYFAELNYSPQCQAAYILN